MIAAGFTHTRQLFADTVLAVIAAPNDALFCQLPRCPAVIKAGADVLESRR